MSDRFLNAIREIKDSRAKHCLGLADEIEPLLVKDTPAIRAFRELHEYQGGDCEEYAMLMLDVLKFLDGVPA
jgi:hypothetical protein